MQVYINEFEEEELDRLEEEGNAVLCGISGRAFPPGFQRGSGQSQSQLYGNRPYLSEGGCRNMRLTNAEIVQYFRDITEIINRREKYPVRFSFALLKNYRALEPENRNIEEARNRLLDEYNRKDSEGKPLYLTTGQIDILPEHQKEWEKGMKELLDIEVEVPVWKVPESILEESDINIEPVILYNCSFMLEEESD